MSETSDRFRLVATGFSQRIDRLQKADWDRPSPCEGWTARDVVVHVVTNATTFLTLGSGHLDVPAAHDDPAVAWRFAREGLQEGLEDELVAHVEFFGPMGPSTLEKTVATFGIGDVLIHTWDLARATGQDERLDPTEVTRLLQSMKPRDAALREGGRFGPRIDAPVDADEQTQLLLFTGRHVTRQ